MRRPWPVSTSFFLNLFVCVLVFCRRFGQKAKAAFSLSFSVSISAFGYLYIYLNFFFTNYNVVTNTGKEKETHADIHISFCKHRV